MKWPYTSQKSARSSSARLPMIIARSATGHLDEDHDGFLECLYLLHQPHLVVVYEATSLSVGCGTV